MNRYRTVILLFFLAAPIAALGQLRHINGMQAVEFKAGLDPGGYQGCLSYLRFIRGYYLKAGLQYDAARIGLDKTELSRVGGNILFGWYPPFSLLRDRFFAGVVAGPAIYRQSVAIENYKGGSISVDVLAGVEFEFYFTNHLSFLFGFTQGFNVMGSSGSCYNGQIGLRYFIYK